LSPQTTFREKIAIFKDQNFLFYWFSGNIAFLGDIFAMFAARCARASSASCFGVRFSPKTSMPLA